MLATQKEWFWKTVPTSVAENSEYRRQMLTLAYSDRELQRELWMICSRDVLFFINCVCWILESRDAADWQIEGRVGTKELPFLLRDYQTKAIQETIGSLGREDIIVEKSRETGVSWVFSAIGVWDWLFHGQTHIGFVSKDETSVDSDDPDSLFSKFEFIVARLPEWMRPRSDRNRSRHTWKNLQNESTITGYAATGNVARGGRKRWMLLDEFHSFPAGDDYAALDSTSAVTHSRVIVSTPNRARGPAGAYYDLVCDESRSGLRLVIDWKDDSEKRRGLYHSDNLVGTETYLRVLDDKEFWSKYANADGTYRNPSPLASSSEPYKFVLDGKMRSIYYDDYCMRPGVTSRSVASELDRNFAGAASTVCDLDVINRAIEAVKCPVITGEIYAHPSKPGEWIFDPSIVEGTTKLWCELTDGKPPVSEYAAGQDISAGTGGAKSSYSVIEIFDKKTGEHVFEWRSNHVDAIRFASLAVWVCKWFHNAYLVPEINGPSGQLFINEVIKMNYNNVYKRRPSGVRAAVVSQSLGYWNSDQGLELLENMQKGIQRKAAHVNSVLALREMSRYLYGADGRIWHSLARVEEDGSGKGKAHGDAAIALGVAWLGVEDWPATREAKKDAEPAEGSYLWRRREYEKTVKSQGQKSYWSPY